MCGQTYVSHKAASTSVGIATATVATVAARRLSQSSAREAIVQAASGRNSAVSSTRACGSTVSISTPVEMWSWYASVAPVEPSMYACVASEKQVTATTQVNATGL